MTTGLDWTYHDHRFIFSFNFNFVFVPCGGLSWLLVGFLLHVKFVSYRKEVTKLSAALFVRNAELSATQTAIAVVCT